MSAVHVRNLDDAVIDALKRRAQANHRSLEGELRAILQAAATEASGRKGAKKRLRLNTVDLEGPSSYGRDEIYADDRD
jgi:plasmid stability protein